MPSCGAIDADTMVGGLERHIFFSQKFDFAAHDEDEVMELSELFYTKPLFPKKKNHKMRQERYQRET